MNELWLGAHPTAPRRLQQAPWTDLAQWQEAEHHTLPFLLKLLLAAKPLSLTSAA
jgi:mannose-6-phosphate isomerase class I